MLENPRKNVNEQRRNRELRAASSAGYLRLRSRLRLSRSHAHVVLRSSLSSSICVLLHGFLSKRETARSLRRLFHIRIMKVICAGLGKTGTTSLAKALQILGFNVYDFTEHFEFHLQQWLDSFETHRHPNFKEIYQGVDAVTDVPPAFWFEEISADFSEAKVILTVRDSEDAWVKSWKEHLQINSRMIPFYVKLLFYILPRMKKRKHFLDALRQAIYGSSNPEATALFRVKYRQHNERVEKLLVFNVKQGWKPLCEFLGCDVPSSPFPRVNVAHFDTKRGLSQLIGETERYIALVILSIVVLLASVFVGLYVTGDEQR